MFRYCRPCGRSTEWVPRKAFQNELAMGTPDFPGNTVDTRGQTVSRIGPAKLVDVWQCALCGRAVTRPTDP